MQRINVIGTSCSGKSTFAARLGVALEAAHTELDSLHWEPGWVEVDDSVFRERVSEAVAGDRWVIDGNYRVVRDLVWARADTIIWLDYPLALVLWRSIRRTARRVIRREMVCNGNRESVRRSLSRDSIIKWVMRTHAKNRREFAVILPEAEARGMMVVRLKSPRAAARWMREETMNAEG